MVSNALDKITPETIKRSFQCYGIAAKGEDVPAELLNSRLREILLDPGTGLAEAEAVAAGDVDEESSAGDSDIEVLQPDSQQEGEELESEQKEEEVDVDG